MNKSLLVCLSLLSSVVAQPVLAVESTTKNATACQINAKQGSVIFKENFDSDLSAWVAEFVAAPSSSIRIDNKKLLLDVAGGATVWLKQPLSGNYQISYTRKVIMNKGKNDRLSDLNQFWMASDPHSSSLFTRTGVFEEYDGLRLYYAGIGGNTNTTSRFRKYLGTGERVLITDLQDSVHMLKANHNYQIDISVYNGCTQLQVDGQMYFSYQDPEPLKTGYFGFRTTQSRQEIDDVAIYRLGF
jgi:rhamnogalacturonan endolyase